MSRDSKHLLRRGMTVEQCNGVLGHDWTDEKYAGGAGLHRIYEAITLSGMVGADLYFRNGKLVKWWGAVDQVAELVAQRKGKE